MSISYRELWKILWILILIAAIGRPLAGAADDYAFDTAETDKKPYQLGGYAEIQPALFFLDRDAALYKTRFYDRNVGSPQAEYDFTLQLDGSYEHDVLRLFARVNNNLSHNYDGWTSDSKPYEAFLAIKPSPAFSTAMGKMTAKWGKGYAWNPVAFVDRPKNPDDPTLNQEGFYFVGLDTIHSFDGPLKTLAFSPLLLPVDGEVNRDFGEPGHINAAAKIYLLLWDTDIDFMFLAGGSRPDRIGFDFSRNILPNLEIHGESAWIDDFSQIRTDSKGAVSESRADVWSALAGLRYLSAAETTYIFEYYHNGTGYSQSEIRDFFRFADRAGAVYADTGNDGPVKKAATLAQGPYGRPNPMQDYLYLRISQKEPFDLLYFTPALTAILNLEDRSFSVSPELVYTGITNLELRLKATFLAGERFSDYGEKPNDARLELRMRYFF